MPSFACKLSLFLFATVYVSAQTAPGPGTLAFDVVSVRPSKTGAPQHSNIPLNSGFVYSTVSPEDARSVEGGYVNVTHQSLWRYIAFAYKLTGTQEMSLRFNIYPGTPKSGAPFWVTGSFDAQADFFDISARAPAGTSIDQMRVMMQSLLADRFQLIVHFETVDAPVFALTLVKAGVTGAHLQPHPVSDACLVAHAEGSDPAVPAKVQTTSSVGDLPPICGVIAHVASSAPGQHFGGRAVSLSALATTVPTMTGLAATPRPVVDQTGLPGLYDFNLNWIHDPSGDEAIGENTASFRDALRTQLGLQLKPSHAPMPFLIVDRVSRPSEN